MSLRSNPLVSLEYNKLLCHLDCKLFSAPKLLSEHGACTFRGEYFTKTKETFPKG